MQDLPGLFTGASVFVFPSFYEGFGLPVLESMSVGVPVAASKSSSLPEVGGKAVCWFDPDNVDDIAKAMMQTATDKNLRNKLLAEAPNQLKKFSWGKMTKELHSELVSLVKLK